MGSHPSIRYWISATEDDDDDDCSLLNRTHVQAIAEFCKIDKQDAWNEPGEVLTRRRKGYADWHHFLKLKEHPAGWLCAQKRALRVLYEWHATATDLPDYLILIDDDTYMDIAQVTEYLETVYQRNDPVVMAGCLIRFTDPDGLTLPWGGWGTILSKATLERLQTPLSCQAPATLFAQESCAQLERNGFYEKQYFQDSMSLLDLMHAYSTQQSFVNHAQWNDTSNFCMHSDWLWGYFFNYYPVAMPTGRPDAAVSGIASYRRSEFFARKQAAPVQTRMALEGQCRYGQSDKDSCTPEATICHYVSEDEMKRIAVNRSITGGGQLVQDSKWPSLWYKNPTKLAVTIKPSPPKYEESSPLPVFFYPNMNHTIQHEVKHFLYDGLQKSERLEISYDYSTAPLWIVDAVRAGLNGKTYCTRMVKMVRERLEVNSESFWRVVILHWEDDASNVDFLECFRMIRLIDSTRVVRFKRSIVQNRKWNDTVKFVDAGEQQEFVNWRDYAGQPVQHLNYGVRSDIYDGVEAIVGGKASESLITRARPVGVSCFWPQPGKDDDLILRGKSSQLRDLVSTMISSFNESFNVFVGLVGEAQDAGRDMAQTAYVEKLVSSKIIVVAQKDMWEDHYRLMEALVSGALVISDPMVSMPEGLREDESIVVYRSMAELAAKIKHYLSNHEERLKIARAGYEVATNFHRSWHMMERIAATALA